MNFFLFLTPICVCLSSFFVIYTIRFFDVVEKEPLKPIIFAFILGIASAFSTVILISFLPTPTLLFSEFLDLGNGAYENLYTFIDAPLIEELLKFAGLIVVYKFFKRDFHTLTDFIIYGCVVAAGFQFLENLEYLIGSVYEKDFVYSWNSMLSGRVIENGYMHLLWTSWSGVGLWVWERTNLKFSKTILFVFISILLHSLNNLAAVITGLFYDPNENFNSFYYLGEFLYPVIRSISLAGFLSIIGFALIRDVNLLNEFKFKIYNNSLSELEIRNLKKLANPISNIFARYKWSWRLYKKYEKTIIDRESYNTFSRYALSFSNEYVGNDEDKKKVYLEKAVNLLAAIE
tara:strand:+ start:337 stop:1374 length:1038 start_codon:yes stop_codon:yes gene_type:complete